MRPAPASPSTWPAVSTPGAPCDRASVPVTELRAAVIVGSGSMSFEMIRALVERLPFMITPKWVNTRSQPIAIGDVLRYLVGCLADERTTGENFDIGGTEVLTYREMMLGFARVRGLKRMMIPVPVLSPRLSSYWVDLITPIPASYARPLIEGLKNEVVVKDDRIRALIPFEPTRYEEAVRVGTGAREPGQRGDALDGGVTVGGRAGAGIHRTRDSWTIARSYARPPPGRRGARCRGSVGAAAGTRSISCGRCAARLIGWWAG